MHGVVILLAFRMNCAGNGSAFSVSRAARAAAMEVTSACRLYLMNGIDSVKEERVPREARSLEADLLGSSGLNHGIPIEFRRIPGAVARNAVQRTCRPCAGSHTALSFRVRCTVVPPALCDHEESQCTPSLPSVRPLRSRSLSPSRPETAEGEMNAEVAYGYRERKAHADAMGEVAHRLHCLQHLKLKTVIKVTTAAPRPEHIDSAMRTTPSMCKESASHLRINSVCNSVLQRKDLVHLVMLSHTMLSPDQCFRC